MTLQDQIEQKLQQALSPVYLEVINESFMHSVPPGSEMHFKVIAVSKKFEGKSLVDRHRMVNLALKEELQEAIHALTMTTHTPAEWEKKVGKSNASPPCLGGSSPPFTMKVITKRHGRQDPIDEGAGMLRLVRQLRGDALIPKGVYRFKSMEEADRWMIHKMASTHVRLFSKT